MVRVFRPNPYYELIYHPLKLLNFICTDFCDLFFSQGERWSENLMVNLNLALANLYAMMYHTLKLLHFMFTHFCSPFFNQGEGWSCNPMLNLSLASPNLYTKVYHLFRLLNFIFHLFCGPFKWRFCGLIFDFKGQKANMGILLDLGGSGFDFSRILQ